LAEGREVASAEIAASAALCARHGYEKVARMKKYVGDFYLAFMRKGLRAVLPSASTP